MPDSHAPDDAPADDAPADDAPADDAGALFERAAAPALRRIDRDLERASGPTRRLLEAIRGHLFRPGLNVAELAGSLRIPSGTLSTQFRNLTGTPPQRYREERRLEAACRLLLDSGLDPQRIAEQLGYSGARSFSDAFARRMGCRPLAYRETAGRAAAPDALPPPEPEPAGSPAPRAPAPEAPVETAAETPASTTAESAPPQRGAAPERTAGRAVHPWARRSGKLGPPVFTASLVACLVQGHPGPVHLLLLALGLGLIAVDERWGEP